MDLEMTGLEPSKHVIVEIATIVTDDELNIVAEGPDLVVHQPEEMLALMEPIVVDMHTKSGLLDAIRASTITLDEAGAATLAFIKMWVPEATVAMASAAQGQLGMEEHSPSGFVVRSSGECSEIASWQGGFVSRRCSRGAAALPPVGLRFTRTTRRCSPAQWWAQERQARFPSTPRLPSRSETPLISG